jgi:hypothetical protein
MAVQHHTFAIAEVVLVLERDVLGLGVAEGPNLVALDPLTRKVPESPVLVFGTRRPQVGQQLDDRVLGVTPVTRTVARMLMPSTRQAMT